MARSVKPEVDAEPHTNRPRILLAEAEANLRLYLTRLLGKQYEIDSAPDPSAALALAHERAPDLIVANADIQKSPSFNRLREFRRDGWVKTPIILYSTACDETASESASETEANFGVITPFS